jgi:hypothetical protein
MLLPHNPYRLPQHYKMHVCGPSCSCKHWFLWISPIFEHYFCLNYMGTVRYWQPFWSTTRVRFLGQCWHFNPIVNCRVSNNQGKLCLKQHYSEKELHSCYVSTYESGYLEGFRRWRGSTLAAQRNSDLHGSWSLPKHCRFSDRREQNSYKLRHTVCNVFRSCLALEG